MTDNHQTSLLWTGGWDSTYRLCELTRNGKKVQPFYILDSTRKSIRHELAAMDTIKVALKQKYTEGSAKILPTIYINQSDIIIDQETSTQYKNLSRKYHIGKQFEWLSAYVKANGLSGMEIAIEKNNFRQRDHFFYYLGKHLISTNNTITLSYESTDQDLLLFKGFSFPIYNTTKIAMLAEAKKYNYETILALTWFCHNPIRNKPCGMCNPCKDAIEEGFAFRVPVSGLMRYKLRKYRKILKNSTNEIMTE